ncbi:O-fucosyltransferase 36-like [Ipomoea triloba]|uniref:O-fucosyltransferase 36-like n=1 Tax=Ipomoea triloba TaxID=35885 RepID=UPI00125E6052|nr:O-fucosyltransferase 36-like [Ipomoea triloba]
MDRESSSDEEEDHRTLIDQNERRGNGKSPVRSTFQINGFESRPFSSRRFNLSSVKRYGYLIAIVLPLIFLILYFATDIKDVFQTGVANIRTDASFNRMRESELRALYLLQRQQLGLFKLWNHTFVNNSSSSEVNNTVNSTYSSNDVSSNSDFSSSVPRSSVSSELLEDFQADLLSQISLNKQIQQVLLSPHKSGNLLDASGNFTDPDVNAFGRCRKVDQRLSKGKTVEWKPRSNKYLFAICVSGQMSNHLICLEKHMLFAALLGRILVIPSSKVDFEFHRVLDIDHINKCCGRKVVVTYEEFAGIRKNHVHIDKFMCYFSQPQPCFMDGERVKKLKSLGVSMNKLETAWDEDVKKPTQRTSQDILAKFSSDDDVIAIGDVFFADVEKDLVMQPGGPISHECKTLIEPSRLIMLTAQRFVQTFLGGNFIAIHFRRHGFLKFCNAKEPSCFYPVPQAADCINRVVERAKSPVIYLSTDAAESETGLLQSLVTFNGKTVPLVKRPARNSAEKWDALLYRHGLEENSQVEAMLDKTICSLSTVFIGSSGSTFTEDILRLRKDWGSASLCDEYLCQGEAPNFIADTE